MVLPILFRRVKGKSMEPAINSGELLVASKIFKLAKNDIVILKKSDGMEIVKRVKDLRGDKLYVQGDNSEFSTDSRHFGWIDRDQIVGKLIWQKSKAI